MPIQTAIDSISNSQGSPFGFKNRIINGGMVIDQRNAGVSFTPTTNTTYVLDRWITFLSQSSKFSVQQNAGSVTPPDGFKNYLGVTSLSAYAIGAEVFGISQYIEGYNMADLSWGTANAKTITISFWVRSSLTGTFGGALKNNAETRAYPFSYTINSANTWEKETITIPGDTTGTWLTTNDLGMKVVFGLGVGSTLSGTAGAWTAGNLFSTTGAVSVVGTNGATWYVTGVQLEKGTQATEFDYRDYGNELRMCQRYYVQSNNAPSTGQFMDVVGRFSGTTQAIYTIYLPVTMRTQPAVSVSPAYNFGGGWYANLAGIANYQWQSAPTAVTSFLLNTVCFYVTVSTISGSYVGVWTDPYCPTTASANYFAITAEL